MAYLDNTSVTIDAILTKKGRELLARGDGTFNIVKFALADDEIDYTLWDSSHTSGTNYYGEAIENLPLVEAIPDETKSLRRKLLSFGKTTTVIPTLNISQTSYPIAADAVNPTVIAPATNPAGSGFDAASGYTVVVSDISVITCVPLGAAALTGPIITGTLSQSQTFIGNTFEIRPVLNYSEDKTATVTITGNDTGVLGTVTFTVTKATLTS